MLKATAEFECLACGEKATYEHGQEISCPKCKCQIAIRVA